VPGEQRSQGAVERFDEGALRRRLPGREHELAPVVTGDELRDEHAAEPCQRLVDRDRPALAHGRPAHYLLPPLRLSTARKARCRTSTPPPCFIRFLPSFCSSRSFRLREMSPP